MRESAIFTFKLEKDYYSNLNQFRLTQENERVFLIVKAVVRLSHPAPLDIVLRKRLCIAIVKRQSIKVIRSKVISYLLNKGEKKLSNETSYYYRFYKWT